MFDFVRKHTRLALGFMLLLIIPSFVFFGIQGYSRFTDGANATLAKVDGHAITQAEFDNAHKRVLDSMRRQNPTADPALLDSPKLRRDTLDGLVRDRMIVAAAEQLHLFPNDARLQRLFATDPRYASIRDPEGRVMPEFLAGQGMTSQMFAQRLRQEFGATQVLAGIAATVPAAATPASAALDAFLQRRAVQLQRYDANAYREKVAPTDAEVEAFYKAHESDFKAPEQATIEYVTLDLETLVQATDPPSDAELRKAYESAGSRFVAPEERRASHILIKAEKDKPAADRAKAKAKAEALLAEVKKNSASFAEVARKNSEDSSAAQGGDLDFFGRGAMVKPFEDATFGLAPGQISGVVETDFGYHIIMVTAKRGGEGKPFEAVRPELEAELRKAAAQKRWADTAEQFTNMVYEQSNSLDPVVTKLKLQKKTATVQRNAAPGATGPLASRKFLDAVFGNEALNNKRNTDAVEVGPNQLISARVLQHQPSRLLPLAEVKDRVRERVVGEQAAALARKEGEAKVAALRAAGANANEALPIVLTLSRAQAQQVPKQLLDAALRADPAKLPAVEGIDLGAQGYLVLRVMQVLPRESVPGDDEALRGQYAQAWGTAEAEAYLAALKKRYKAEVKPAAEAAFAAAAASASLR